MSKLNKCSICGSDAEISDANDSLSLSNIRYVLIQCSNGSCKNASWGDAYWNENQEYILALDKERERLKAVLDQMKIWSDREECCCHELIDELLEAGR